MKYTKAGIQNRFKNFIEGLGGRVATNYNDVGAYRLDYNPIYGGYVIERVQNKQGGVSMPFGYSRMKAAAFIDALAFAESTVRIIQNTEVK